MATIDADHRQFRDSVTAEAKDIFSQLGALRQLVIMTNDGYEAKLLDQRQRIDDLQAQIIRGRVFIGELARTTTTVQAQIEAERKQVAQCRESLVTLLQQGRDWPSKLAATAERNARCEQELKSTTTLQASLDRCNQHNRAADAMFYKMKHSYK